MIIFSHRLTSHVELTISQIRKEVPKEMLPSKTGALNSSLFLLTGNVTMVSYVPRKNRVVVLLSSQHLDPPVTEYEQNETNMILEYNKS